MIFNSGDWRAYKRRYRNLEERSFAKGSLLTELDKVGTSTISGVQDNYYPVKELETHFKGGISS